ncbi:STAS domain-containing protein [Aquibacillus koreensis]|uniref:STAS domain-containing protein n=1 Tax=Aquibacillus koreensis TaxID=279446 RepID=A0A9X4AJ08_9BACI|nr:STAS domain-containing protein [Aquibacillus koreensis]MCT2537052.1 STAS domain-containing protein [Aquibacillus koreensis]MDC3419965.1 STAS domain-containing protein [Aquibacillus koreensis]
MSYSFKESFQLKDFVKQNNMLFEEELLNQAQNVTDKMDEILRIGNIDLVTNAHKLVIYIIDNEYEEIQAFAKQEGIAWAMQSIAISFKLEWIQAIRRTLWIFIQKYNDLSHAYNLNKLFVLEKEINSAVDNFLNIFFINYSIYKDKLITQQKELVRNLSVPIIPINASTSVLPLIGEIEETRANILEEKVLNEVSKMHIQTLIMDVSGIAYLEETAIAHLLRVIDGTAMMGCTTIMTGLRKEVVRTITDLGVSLEIKTYGTLQQALHKYLV